MWEESWFVHLCQTYPPLPNLQGLAKFETTGEACGESFFEFFLWSESARSPLPNLQGLAKCRYPLLNLSSFAKP